MTELQEARKLYIDALEREFKLQAEVERLTVLNFELMSKYISARTEAIVNETTAVMMTRVAFCGHGQTSRSDGKA